MSMNPAALAAQIEASKIDVACAGLRPIMVFGPVGQTFSGDRKNPLVTDVNYPGITIRSDPAYGAHSYQVRNYAFVGPNRGVLIQGEVLAGTDQSQYFATFDALTFTGVGNGWEANIPVWGSRFDNLIFNEGATFKGISRGGGSKANTFGNLVFMCKNMNVENPLHLSSWNATFQGVDIEDHKEVAIYADGGSTIHIQNLEIERWTPNGKPLLQVQGTMVIDQLIIQAVAGSPPVDLVEIMGVGMVAIGLIKLSAGTTLSVATTEWLAKTGTTVIRL